MTAAEAEQSWILVRSLHQTSKTLDPTIPMMQCDSIYTTLLYTACLY